MTMMTDQMNQWAKIGAGLRLQQLDRERDEILRAFPGLGRGAIVTAASPRKRRKMSAKARALISAAMKKRWAERKRG